LTGLGIMGFAAAVYAYSINAVKQDDFSDIPTANPNAGKEGAKTIEEEMAEKGARFGNRGIGAMAGFGSSPQGEGVKIPYEPTTSGLQDTQRASSPQPTPLSSPLPPSDYSAAATVNDVATSLPSARPASRFIIGAPDVDRFGKLGDRRNVDAAIDGKRVA
jgi:cytochrome c oxidase assembly factor 3